MAAVAIASAFAPKPMPRRVWILAAIGAGIPDLDAIGRPFGGGDLAVLGGHRALTHSIFFAGLLSVAALALLRRSVPGLRPRVILWVGLFLALQTRVGTGSPVGGMDRG